MDRLLGSIPEFLVCFVGTFFGVGFAVPIAEHVRHGMLRRRLHRAALGEIARLQVAGSSPAPASRPVARARELNPLRWRFMAPE